MRVVLTALTMAEFSEIKNKQDVYFLTISSVCTGWIRSINTFRKNASAVGCQPTLSTEVGELQERITSTKDQLLLFKLFMYLLMI
jgi:F-type H+-transporting ATPase subunit beta